MDIVVKGRRTQVSERFRQLAADKLAKLERFDHKVIRIDVEVCREANPRQAGQAERVELTCISRGPVVRAEAAAADSYAALDAAYDKLQMRLRRDADRRRVHHGQRTPVSVAAATAAVSAPPAEPDRGDVTDEYQEAQGDPSGPQLLDDDALGGVDGDGPLVVREKEHRAAPMALDEALREMELVGHDFFLFSDRATGRPSVVYRRRGYDYGVIRLSVAADAGGSSAEEGGGQVG